MGACSRAWFRLRSAFLALAIALTAAATLNAEDRDQWQQPDRVIQDLALRAGANVADIGCGKGYFTFRLGQAVGQQGKVVAVDVDQESLKAIRERVSRERLSNIETVVSHPKGAKLPAEACDSALFCLVLHEVAPGERSSLVQDVAKAVKPGGFLFIIDWRKSHEVKFDPYDKLIPQEALVKLATDAGLSLDAEFHYLKYEVFLRFRKPAKP